jgi:hypothetical protein
LEDSKTGAQLTGTLTVDAPAKLNLHLSIGERGQDGFHQIESIFLAISLCDTLTISVAGDRSGRTDAKGQVSRDRPLGARHGGTGLGGQASRDRSWGTGLEGQVRGLPVDTRVASVVAAPSVPPRQMPRTGLAGQASVPDTRGTGLEGHASGDRSRGTGLEGQVWRDRSRCQTPEGQVLESV